MAETTIDPAQADTAQADTADTAPARALEEPGPITADLGTIVTRAARRFGGKTALIAPGRTLTYRELDDLCDRVAGGLHGIGVRPGTGSRSTRPTGGSGWSPTTRRCARERWSTPST